MTTTTDRPPGRATSLWDEVPPTIARTDPDGTPRRFFEVQTTEWVTLDDLGFVPQELLVEITAAAERTRAANLAAMRRFVWWCDLPASSQRSIIRRARRRRRRELVARVRTRSRP